MGLCSCRLVGEVRAVCGFAESARIVLDLCPSTGVRKSVSSQLSLGQPFKAVLQEVNKDTREEHRSCLGAFGRLQSSYDDAPSSANLRQWAAVVARYSFRP
jgi:hypothetical protein